jgi:hypothetical protein
VVVVVLVAVVVAGKGQATHDPSGRVPSKEQTWQSPGPLEQSEQSVLKTSQELYRMHMCLGRIRGETVNMHPT